MTLVGGLYIPTPRELLPVSRTDTRGLAWFAGLLGFRFLEDRVGPLASVSGSRELPAFRSEFVEILVYACRSAQRESPVFPRGSPLRWRDRVMVVLRCNGNAGHDR